MDNIDDSENNAKISDSAYSNSCSNSQSRRSHSSKSTHSGSHSSGSSGYGGKPSTSGSSNQPPEKRLKEKDPKKKKQTQVDTLAVQQRAEVECRPPEPAPVFETPLEVKHDVIQTPTLHVQTGNAAENLEIVAIDRAIATDEIATCNLPSVSTAVSLVISKPTSSYCSEGFSCVISMYDGVVIYTTSNLTSILGYPKDMWIGRSFIDFVHPRDRNTFASQITNGLAVPKTVNGTLEKVQSPGNSESSMVCRIRRYRGLSDGFGVKERVIGFMPFLLKLTFKNVSDDNGKTIYLVIQLTPFDSAFKVANERLSNSVPFVIRHAANGLIEYLDPQSVPYLGYLPQDLTNSDAFQLYHPADLGYLRHVYETIVREGGMTKCKPYRMLTQNGDYITLETEWSSFINPWSRELEFVIGKHYIVEGPTKPDVFQPPEIDNGCQMTEEERIKVQQLRESIVRVLNEVLIKPTEVAKQQMSKQCQDLASFMESLMEEPDKSYGDFRLEIQEPEHSFYERDSVMLGGISPHHEYSDSKSSTATPLSYTQLNYNETLQRYFDSNQPYQYMDYNTMYDENMELKETNLVSCLPPMAQNFGDSAVMASSYDRSMMVAYSRPRHIDDRQHLRLTESLIGKHNTEMEKELLKIHRGNRSLKSEREKTSSETRKKKKEHLARCNASFQPTCAGVASANAERVNKPQGHGVKRTKPESPESPHKVQCTSSRSLRTREHTNVAPAELSSSITTTAASSYWPANTINNMNTFVVGVGIPQQMPIMTPMITPQITPMIPQQMAPMIPQQMPPMIPQQMTPMPGMYPMYYTPVTAAAPIQHMHQIPPNSSSKQGSFPAPSMQCMMYGQTIYGSPFMYSPISPPVSYPGQQPPMAQSMQYTTAMNPLGLASSNYEEACKSSMQLSSSRIQGRWNRTRTVLGASSKIEQINGDSSSSNNALSRSIESNSVSDTSRTGKCGVVTHQTESNVDKTDGKSSYSSFYSSFFKTESGSAEESGADEKKNSNTELWNKRCLNNDKQSSLEPVSSLHERQCVKNLTRRRTDPPWMEQVCVTSELIYKYQVLTKSAEEVLSTDKQKLAYIEQPSLVNEQLSQLYLDLQLQGVAAKLTLEEGITSSSSSSDDNSNVTLPRSKRGYNKLVMIYEEDAPLPPPSEEEKIPE